MKGTSKMNGLLRKSKLYLKRSSPTILTCASVIGMVATTVMAVRVTPKATRLIEQSEVEKKLKLGQGSESLDGELTPLEIIQLTWRCYIPAALVGLSTIVCIFGANILNERNQASLASAYALLNQSHKRYKKAATSLYGEDADSKILKEVAKEMYVSADGHSLYSPDTNNGEVTLFYDEQSERYFTSTIAAVINAQYHFNRNLTLRGGAYLNEFYDFLGIDHTDFGDSVGWYLYEMMDSGLQWLDFENQYVKLEDGMECYIIRPLCEPTLPNYD